MMEYILNNGADVDEGSTKISPRSKKPKSGIVSPLTYSVTNRIPSAIRILLQHGASVSQYHKDKWLEYIHEARTPNERDKLD